MSPSGKPVVALAGLGNMGSAMASRLQEWLETQDDFDKTLRVWNRTTSKAKPHVEKGATLVEEIPELAKACQICFTMLINDNAVKDFAGAFLDAKPPAGTLLVDCSTVYPTVTAGLAERAREQGVTYLACNVFGRPDAVADGQGLFTCAGDPEGRSKVAPLLQAMGKGIIECGDEPKASNVLKLAGNYCISGAIEMFAEAMTLAEANGVKREAFQQFTDGFFPGRGTKGYCKTLVEDSFKPTPEDPGFALAGGIKDVSHMVELAKSSNCRSPLADATLAHMQEAQNMGYKDLDWSVLALPLRKAAGIPLPDLS